MFAFNKKHNDKFIGTRFPLLFLIVFIVICLILAGCSTKATPTSETEQPEITQAPDTTNQTDGSMPSIVRFPDGSEISLEPDSYLEIIKVSGLSSDDSGHEVLLHRGKIEINSQLPEGTWFTVYNRSYHFARVTGSIMILFFNPETGNFMMNCVEGVCEFGQKGEPSLSFEGNQQGCVDEKGHFIGPFNNVGFDELRELCVYDPTKETEPPKGTDTAMPSKTPDSKGTSTAACHDFESQFPGTPCP